MKVKVEKIIYCKGNFAILKTDHGTCLGNIAWSPNEGEMLDLTGEFEINNKFGSEKQFRFSKAETVINIDPRAELHYACSLTKGIGESKEDAIWKMFGDDWKKADLNKIKGLTIPAKEAWKDTLIFLDERKELTKTMSGLLSLGMTDRMVEVAIEKFSSSAAYKIISDNPYMISELPNFGFSHADTVALRLDISLDDKRRIKAGIRYAMSQSTNGSSCIPVHDLINHASNTLGCSVQYIDIQDCVNELISENFLVDIRGWISTKEDHENEMIILNYFEGV